MIPKEFPGITCRNIDVDLDSQGTAQLADQILAEHLRSVQRSCCRHPPGERWIESLERSRSARESEPRAA